MNTTTCTHKDNPNFWIFGLFFFLYFFIMATCFPFLPIWLSDVIGLNKTHTGIVFSCISLSAIAFQPVLGVISDKLGLKKHLLWIITVLLFLFAPFFLYVFAPLLKTSIWLGAVRFNGRYSVWHRPVVCLLDGISGCAAADAVAGGCETEAKPDCAGDECAGGQPAADHRQDGL